MPAFIKSDDHITLLFDHGDTATVYNTSENFDAVCTAVEENNWEQAELLSKPAEVVKLSFKDIENVAIQDGVVTFNGVPMHSTLTDRILEMNAMGDDVTPMALFLEHLMDNPSPRSVNELYTFLEKSNLPITEDGHFLAYKRIAKNYTDMHTGKFDNSPGMFVEMLRNSVDEDKNHTCSAGLHFCSREYLPSYGSYGESKVVMIKINPADVVAIPSDYNDAKGRCCKYYVVEEMPIDVDSYGMLPSDHLEIPFKDTRTVVDELMVEQLNLSDVLFGGDDPKVLKTFASSTEAMRKETVDSSSITKTCNGERKSAGGFAWRWAHENPLNRL